MTTDIVIRGGTVYDGTGAPGVVADVAIADRVIREIGPNLRGARELDASGCAVAPGFIDIHTHYDAQVFWDPALRPSSYHGVTTVVAGNCGISLAPMPAGRRPQAVPPLDLLSEDGRWYRFPTFLSYVEELQAKPAATNCALLVGHSSLRVAEMDDLERTGHLPRLVEDLIGRLRISNATSQDSDAGASAAAITHGELRFRQGYTPAMLVHESRILQVTIFETLQSNLNYLDFSLLLPDVMTIADEVDAQLKEQMLRFMAADAAKRPRPGTSTRVNGGKCPS
jgi:N-acyl-D-aspartate/D-glutamate deacylase